MSGVPRERLPEHLQARLKALPLASGVYLFSDTEGTIVYVGKAKNLRSRVRSYFNRSGDDRAFVPRLAGLLGDIETIITANEKEALLLENTLIKKHQPRFNVMMRDDKRFLVLRLDPRVPYPRLEARRVIEDDGARYFGPYTSAAAARETLRVINRYFKLRSCTDRVLARRTRPCLQHQIGRCPAPCVFDIDAETYRQEVEDVTLFLRGQKVELLETLRARMTRAADALDFEHAAHLRDQIAAIEHTLEHQDVTGDTRVDQDVFGVYREGDAFDIVVLILRRGQVVGRRHDAFSGQEFPTDELLSAYISQYYDRPRVDQRLPREILVPLALEDAEVKAQWLSELARHRVAIRVPRRGHKHRLIELALRNARHTFEARRRKASDISDKLAKLQARLHLTHLPRHIECYDISQLQGAQVVASMVVMRDGEPDPSSYRHFRLSAERRDDFSALYEVLSRRLRRAREGQATWKLPDLIVIDGGKGQLSSALAALRDVDFPPNTRLPEMVGLAKERVGPDAAGEARPDRVFRPRIKDPLRLRPNTTELFLLSRLRDEAHRVAIGHHRRLRKRHTLRSGLDDIPGIGKKRKAALLRTLGSLRAIQHASVDELRAVPGMSRRAAEAVHATFATAEDLPTRDHETDDNPDHEESS